MLWLVDAGGMAGVFDGTQAALGATAAWAGGTPHCRLDRLGSGAPEISYGSAPEKNEGL